MKPDRTLEIHYYDWRLTAWAMSETRNRLNCAGRGIYRELLDQCYAQGGFPNDPDWICRTCACAREEYEIVWPQIKKNFNSARRGTYFVNTSATLFRKKTFLYIKTQVDRRVSAIRKAQQAKELQELAPSKPGASILLRNVTEENVTERDVTERNDNDEAPESPPESLPPPQAVHQFPVHQFPQLAAAVRKRFQATDDQLILIIARDAIQAHLSVKSPIGPPPDDRTLAEAVEVCSRESTNQHSPALYRTTVSNLIRNWAREPPGRIGPPLAPKTEIIRDNLRRMHGQE